MPTTFHRKVSGTAALHSAALSSNQRLVATIRSYPPGAQIDVTISAPAASNQLTVPITLGTETLSAAT